MNTGFDFHKDNVSPNQCTALLTVIGNGVLSYVNTKGEIRNIATYPGKLVLMAAGVHHMSRSTTPNRAVLVGVVDYNYK